MKKTSRILIIDDDRQVREMLRFRLEGEGYEIEEAADGASGLTLFQKKEFLLVITDLIMAGMEGVETIRKLKALKRDLKIIAISGGGRGDPADYLKIAKGMGADRTFSKPVDWEEMLAAVKELI